MQNRRKSSVSSIADPGAVPDALIDIARRFLITHHDPTRT